MNLRQLEVFQAVMSTQNMSAAAHLLALTPSAVSKTISHTEIQLGYKLFARGRLGLVPTPEARALFGEAQLIHARLEELKKVAHNLKNMDRGSLRIAAIPSICHEFFPKLLEHYLQQHPQVDIEVRSLHQNEILQVLLQRGLDFAMGFFSLSHPKISSQTLLSRPLYAAVSRDIWLRALRSQPTMPLSFLHKVPLIRLVDDDPMSTSIQTLAQRWGFGITSNIKVQTSKMALEFVARGLGWTVVDFLTAGNLPSQSMVAIELQGSEPTPVCIYSLVDAPPAQHALRLLELLPKFLAASIRESEA